MIPAEARRSMEGMIPSMIATVSKDGEPNVSYVSQVFWVDDSHLAVSHQYFSKTIRNLRENPQVALSTIDPKTLALWEFDAVHLRTDTDGPVFENMEMQLEAIASMTGMSEVFKLQAAEIFRVTAVRTFDLAKSA